MNEGFPTENNLEPIEKNEAREAAELSFETAQTSEQSILEKFRNASQKARSFVSIFSILTAVACAPEIAHGETGEEIALRAQKAAEASVLKSQQATEQAIFKSTQNTSEHFQKMFTPTVPKTNSLDATAFAKKSAPAISAPREIATNAPASLSPDRVIVEGSEQTIDGKKLHIEKRTFKGYGIEEISTVLVDESGKVVRLISTEDAKTGSGRREIVSGSEHLSGTTLVHIEKRKFVGYGLDIVNVVEVDESGKIIKILETQHQNGK